MQSVYHIIFLVGIMLIAVANFGLRRADAPGLGSGPFVFPWHAHDRFTSLGFKLNLVGQVLWFASAVLAGISLF